MPAKKKKGNLSLYVFIGLIAAALVFWRKAKLSDFSEFAAQRQKFLNPVYQKYWYEVLNGMRQPNQSDADSNTANYQQEIAKWKAFKKSKYLW